MFVEINGDEWEIVEVNPSSFWLQRSDKKRVGGVCDNSIKTIFISNAESDPKKTKILTHELCHAFCFSYGISLPLEVEETLADFVATFGRDIIDLSRDIMEILLDTMYVA